MAASKFVPSGTSTPVIGHGVDTAEVGAEGEGVPGGKDRGPAVSAIIGEGWCVINVI